MTLVGRHIGRYRILEQLGSGGMSVVYKGLDTELEREVAVKVLHTHLAQKSESRARLSREAKAVARLHHPNILEVYDFAGDVGEEAYLVTEYIRGQTLKQFADGTAFEPPEVAALVIAEIAGALAQAHEAGIIHRDLKPENVMVRHDGVIKLMDFGIARIIDRDDRMTMTGALVGSPAHMAPEIIEGEEAGAEADVFSLGTMLYGFAAGRLPFAGTNTTSTLKRILDGVYEDPRQLVPTVSDDLAEIIATCLARQPSSRYPDAGKLRDALHGYLQPLGLGRVSEELSAFFTDPAGYRQALTPRLAEALVARGEKLIADQRPAKALAALNQVLALDPQNARALTLVAQMNAARKQQRNRARWQKIAVATGAAVALVGVVAAGWVLLPQQPPSPAPTPVRVEVPPPAVAAPTPDAEPEAEPLVKIAAREAPGEITPAVVRPPPPTAAASALLPVAVTLRPYGFLQVDGAAPSTEQKRHLLQLPPGSHQLTIGCAFCEPVKQTIEVKRDGTGEFYFPVRPRPARVAFEFDPGEAWVRIAGGEPRRVVETIDRPFEVALAVSAGGVQREIEYEVFLPGYRPLKQRLTLTPGETVRVPGTLERE